jgi:hypothetical protein
MSIKDGHIYKRTPLKIIKNQWLDCGFQFMAWNNYKDIYVYF